MTYSTWFHHGSQNNEIFSSQLWIYLKFERGGGDLMSIFVMLAIFLTFFKSLWVAVHWAIYGNAV